MIIKRYDPELIASMIRLHAEGKSRAAIARELACSPGTIGSMAKDANLNWDRSQSTVAAVASKTADNKMRRLDIASRLYSLADRELQRLEASEYTHRVSAGPTSFIATDPVANADEIRNHTQAIYSALTSAAKLEALDLDPGVSAAKNTLTQISVALGIVSKSL